MPGEGKSTHSNTSSWKCWFKKDKLWGSKTQILFSTCIFKQRRLDMIYSNMGYSEWDSPVFRRSKQASQPQKRLEEEVQTCCPARKEISQVSNPIWVQAGWSLQLRRKSSGMNQILIQHRSPTHPCLWGYAPIRVAGTRAGWECQGRGLLPLGFQQSLIFSLQRETTFLWAVCWRVPGGPDPRGHQIRDE